MKAADIPLLRRSRLLAEVPEADLQGLLAGCFVQVLPRGSLLCRQGEQPEFLHVVLSGSVGLFDEGAREETLVEFFGPGDCFILAARRRENVPASSAPTRVRTQ